MQASRLALPAFSLLCALAVAQPVMAQDVLARPQEGGGATDNDASWWQKLFNSGGSDTAKPAPKQPDDKPAQPAGGASVFIPPSDAQPSSQDSTLEKNKGEITHESGKALGKMNDLLDSLQRPRTQVFDIKDNADVDDRQFENRVSLSAGKLVFSDNDLKQVAAGTEMQAADVLSRCEPRFSGALMAQDGTGESYDLRGTGTASSGYKGALSNLSVVLTLACRLNTPPVDRGMVAKFGDRYSFGVAQTTCQAPPDMKTIGNITISYEGSLTCSFN